MPTTLYTKVIQNVNYKHFDKFKNTQGSQQACEKIYNIKTH